MSKSILFVRVSTDSQQLESQEDSLRRFALADGCREEDLIIIGKKESAIKLAEEEREGLQELYHYIELGDIDTIYIFELSRLSRKPSILYSVRDRLLSSAVQLKCLNPSFSLLTPNRTSFDSTANIIFSLFGALAEQEMIEKKVRFSRGKRRLAEEGRYNGGNIPFGYRIDRENNNKIVIDENESKIVREIFNLYESGISQPKLARLFVGMPVTSIKKMTISFINNMLSNDRYTGRPHCYPGSSYVRSYPVIITPEQFDRCREIARENNICADKTRNIYYAYNILVCPVCGRMMRATGSKCSYRCYDNVNPMRDYDNYSTPRCTNNTSISINIVDSLLWHIAKDAEVDYILNEAEEKKANYSKQIDTIRMKLSTYEYNLSELDKKKERIVELYTDGDITKEDKNKRFNSINDERSKIYLEQTRLKEQIIHINSLITDIGKSIDYGNVDGVVDYLEMEMSLAEKISSITDDELRSQICHRHIKRVSFVNTKIEFEFGIGRKITPSRFITIELYCGETLYYHYMPAGKKGTILRAIENGEPVELISFEYFDRFHDTQKTKAKIQRKEEREEISAKYPSDRYVMSYDGLAKFLHCNVSSAHRWMNKIGLLKPALVEENCKGQIVVDKVKCMDILRENAKTDKWIAKLLKKIDDIDGE